MADGTPPASKQRRLSSVSERPPVSPPLDQGINMALLTLPLDTVPPLSGQNSPNLSGSAGEFARCPSPPAVEPQRLDKKPERDRASPQAATQGKLPQPEVGDSFKVAWQDGSYRTYIAICYDARSCHFKPAMSALRVLVVASHGISFIPLLFSNGRLFLLFLGGALPCSCSCSCVCWLAFHRTPQLTTFCFVLGFVKHSNR